MLIKISMSIKSPPQLFIKISEKKVTCNKMENKEINFQNKNSKHVRGQKFRIWFEEND